MTSPDRFAQAQRIDEEIAELQRRKHEVLEGRGGTATAAQVSEQLREVLAMTRSLPADFRQLRSMVEDRHKVIAREALAETPKADMVESYLADWSADLGDHRVWLFAPDGDIALIGLVSYTGEVLLSCRGNRGQDAGFRGLPE